jgi:DNA-binding CsgD family transcriptional regulator
MGVLLLTSELQTGADVLIAPSDVVNVTEGGAFERWDRPAFVLDAAGRVLIKNRMAAELIEGPHGVALLAAIAGAVDAATAFPRDRLALPCASGGPPFQAMLAPLPFLDAVLLVLTDSGHGQAPIERLARQFRLTGAEQRLAEHIVNGVTVVEAAQRLGIRESTARSRLKVIQTKTHCRRQVDLVRLAFGLSTCG